MTQCPLRSLASLDALQEMPQISLSSGICALLAETHGAQSPRRDSVKLSIIQMVEGMVRYVKNAHHSLFTYLIIQSNVRGGFFLREDLALFDGPFFGMNAAEAAVSRLSRDHFSIL